MKAAVYHGPGDVRYQEWPTPKPGPGEALLQVLAGGICGTDLRILAGQHRKYPPGTLRVPGHEVVGTLVEVGAGAEDLTLGARYFVAPNIGCGHCRECLSGRNNLCRDYDAFGITLDGAFAEYMLVPAAAVRQGNLMQVSETLDPALLTLTEPLACVLHGQEACHIRPGDTVLVIGAGPIGIMHLLLARIQGAAQVLVSEMAPERLAQALRFGADHAINPEIQDLEKAVEEVTEGRGADVVLVAAPSGRAQQDALKVSAIGAHINYFGGLPQDQVTIPFNSNLVHYRELIVTGTTGCSTADCRRALDLVVSGRLDLGGLVSARLPLADVRLALAQAAERQALKIVLVP